jgi:signal transduction histidine kinase
MRGQTAAQAGTPEESAGATSALPPLSGRRLILARTGWVAVTLTVVGLNLIALPDTYGSYFNVTPQVLHELRGLGLSPMLYGLLLTAENAPLQLIYLALGLLLFLRRSEEWMALLCAFTFVTFGGTLLLFDYGSGSIAPSLADRAPLRVVALFLFALGQASLVLFFYVFPSGRFAPRWTRWSALLVAAYWLAAIFFPALASQAGGWTAFLVPLFWLSAAVAQIYRFWRISTPRERQQTKWAVFGLALAMVFLAVTIPINALVVPSSTQNDPLYGSLNPIFQVALLLIPIFITIAVFRTRLWDIDILINRTLVYGALTICVVGLYVLVVGYLGALFRTGGNLLISLIATGVVALLFQPLRGWLQRGVNRLTYGQRDEPYLVVAQLGRRLASAPAPEALLPAIIETVAQALKLPYAAIALKRGDELHTEAVYGTPVEVALTLPLVYQAETIGQLTLGPRQRGETFTPADRRLLEDLARQVGVAAHAVQLTADLQRSRERLVTTREEERRRLRRDLHDGLGSALSSLMLKLDATDTLLDRDLPAARALLAETRAQMQASVTDIRRLVYDLRPPTLDEWGLVDALREQVAHYALDDVRVTIEAPQSLPSLSAAIEVAVYRIALEALANVVKHAHATTCAIRLSLVDNTLVVEIEDNGLGRATGTHTGVGMTAMRERAAELGGSCVIEDAPPHGTQVRATIPLTSE